MISKITTSYKCENETTSDPKFKKGIYLNLNSKMKHIMQDTNYEHNEKKLLNLNMTHMRTIKNFFSFFILLLLIR